jgi:hypothetical protein
MDRTQSHAYAALRASSRRVLRLVEAEIVRQGGGRAVVYYDQLECCGSRRAYVPAMSELQCLGLIDVERYQKKHISRWHYVTTPKQAMIVTGVARARPMPPQMVPTQLAASNHAQT